MFYGRKLRRAAKFAWVLAVNAAILAILLEVSGLAYFALRDGHLYYLGRDEIVTARVAEMGTGLNGADPEELRRRLKEGLSQNKFRLNPYYGYQYEANYRVPVEDFHIRPAEMASNCKFRVNVLCDHGSVYFVTNNFGFDSVLNYPYRKQSDDEFVIGIFGGSIALSVVKSTMPQLFDEVFAQVPQLHGKKVVLLSFAREGFKQPQELETLAYFLSLGQRFDLVINIDGASEIFDAIINYNARVNHSMPSNGQLSALTGLIDAAIHETGNEAFLGVYFWRSVRERILRSLLDVPLAGPASLLDLSFGLAGRCEAAAERQALNPSSFPRYDHVLYMLPQPAGTTLPKAIEQGIEEWKRSSLLMAQMLHGLGIPYLQVLHPNQYFSKKHFSDEEKRVAIRWGNEMAPKVHEYYPRMIAEGNDLAREGVNFANAVNIFDDVSETIYSDECCHYNAAGNLLLARIMAAHLPPL